jgi:thioredoxin domain-containing protein 5
MAPTWEELAQSLDETLGVTVGKVDCTVHRSVCNEFEVKGYPTLLWIEDGVKVCGYTHKSYYI